MRPAASCLLEWPRSRRGGGMRGAMAAIEDHRRSPSFAVRRRHYGTQLKLQILRIASPSAAMFRPATRADIEECYRAILGREPEDGRTAEGHLRGQPLLRDIVAKLAGSGELKAKNLYSNIAFERAREPNYLAQSFGEMQRVRAYFGHYGFLTEALSEQALQALITRRPTIYVHAASPVDCRVVVTATHERHEEGELQLQLLYDDVVVYVMGVTVVPGELLGLPDRHALLISRMQGVAGAFWEIRQATKGFGDIHPRAVLLAALRGMADALGIAAIAGVAGSNQLAYHPGKGDAYAQTYDEFFAAAGAVRLGRDFHLLTPERKAAGPLSRAHARRAERRRRLRAEITSSAASETLGWTAAGAASSRPPATVIHTP